MCFYLRFELPGHSTSLQEELPACVVILVLLETYHAHVSHLL